MTAVARSRCLRSVTSAAEKGASSGSGGRPVLYWMSRDQRVHDNWALLHARDLAVQSNAPLAVVFCLAPSFPGATIRGYDFLLRGLEEVETNLNKIGVPFFVLAGDPHSVLPKFARDSACDTLVMDFSPMPIKKLWNTKLIGATYPPSKGEVSMAPSEVKSDALPPTVRQVVEVDAHNIVPVWTTSDKREHAARTIRRKVHSHLQKFLVDFPALTRATAGDKVAVWPIDAPKPGKIDWKAMRDSLKVDMKVGPVSWIVPGEEAGLKAAKSFAQNTERLQAYHATRNDPNANGQSGLSPWFHFGQLSAQRVVLMAKEHAARHSGAREGSNGFIEETVVRRELSDNYLYYSGAQPEFPQWALESLAQHKDDQREFVYSEQELEYGKTHDELWNAAQLEMVLHGKMHGFMRMYWAKKILEWTPSAEKAFDIALRLNDKYELDGRDPNGFVGVAWSIYGVHDQGWTERKVFGKIRFMNYAGCKRKFDITSYVNKVKQIHAAAEEDTALRQLAELCPTLKLPEAAPKKKGGRARSSSRSSTSSRSSSAASTKQKKRRQPAAKKA